MLVEIGVRFGLRAVRVPLESARVLRAIEPQTASAPALLTAHRWRCCCAGASARPACWPRITMFGLQWSGQMSSARLSGLIGNLPDGLSEIYLHPATGAFDGAAPGYRYRQEFDALMAPEVVAAGRAASLRLGGFGDFQPARHAA